MNRDWEKDCAIKDEEARARFLRAMNYINTNPQAGYMRKPFSEDSEYLIITEFRRNDQKYAKGLSRFLANKTIYR